MSNSRNEIQMLGQKAARGAGAFPAQAAHFGQALVFHLAARRDETAVLDALAALPAGPIQTAPVIVPDAPLGQSYQEAALPPDQRPSLPERLFASDHLTRQLNALAKEILVPNSAASRSSGAGAGLSDND